MTTQSQPPAAGEAAHYRVAEVPLGSLTIIGILDSSNRELCREQVRADGIEQARKDFAFIVRACNSHAALVEALTAIAHEVRAYPDSPRSYSGDSYLPEKFVQRARDALTVAQS